jgi:cell wall-associated NlpC family hydrolase
LVLSGGALAASPAQAAPAPAQVVAPYAGIQAAAGLAQPLTSAALQNAGLARQAAAAQAAGEAGAAARAQAVLSEAKKHTGKRYRFGASGPGAFDCSGYTKYVYKKALGKNLPHKANSQQRNGKAVSKKDARPGDLIVIRRGSYGYHVGVYAGGGYMYDSPRPGKKVDKRKIWSQSYVVRRLV